MNQAGRKRLGTLLYVFFLYLISRTGIYITSYFGYNLFAKYNAPAGYSVEECIRMVLPETIEDTYFPKLKDFIKFDSHYYIKIAEKGYDRYRMDEPHPPADWPFFPLLPILMRLVHMVVPIGYEAVGFLLSNIFSVLAMFFLCLISEKLTGDEEVGRKSVIYLMLYPSSLYLSIIYTEGLFLLLSTLTVYLAAEKKYDWAILTASLSTVARIPGVTNLMFIALVLWEEAGYNPFRIKWRYYLEFVLSGLPLLIFFTYMKMLTGDFFAVVHELSLNWGREAGHPFKGYIDYFDYLFFVTPAGWDLSPAGFLLTTFILPAYLIYIIFSLIKGKSIALGLYGLVLILIPLSGSTFAFTSVVRYYMVSFPLYIILAESFRKKTLAEFASMTLFAVFQAIYVIGFINEYYFAV